MNERIKELAEQAGIYNLELTDETEYWILEKFAELIVGECASICYKSFENGDMIAGLLMQTFGVEEK